MQSDTDEIVQHLFGFVREQQEIIVKLGRNDLLFIESALAPESSGEALAAAAATVRATLYSVDSLTDRIRELEPRVRKAA